MQTLFLLQLKWLKNLTQIFFLTLTEDWWLIIKAGLIWLSLIIDCVYCLPNSLLLWAPVRGLVNNLIQLLLTKRYFTDINQVINPPQLWNGNTFFNYFIFEINWHKRLTMLVFIFIIIILNFHGGYIATLS